MWLILFYLAIGLISILYTKRQWRLWILSSKLPGPPSYPIIGTASLAKNNGDILKNLIEMRKKYSTPMKLWMGIDLNVVVDRPEDVKAIFTSNKCLDRMSFYRFIKNFIGLGVVTVDTPEWQFHRKLLNPSFTNLNIQAFIPVFDAKSKTLVETLKGETGDFDLHPFINNCVLDLICETSTGVDMKFQKQQNMGYIKATERLLKLIIERTGSPWLYPDFIYNKTGTFKELKKHVQVTDGFIDDVFKSNQKKISNNSVIKKDSFLIDQLMDLYQNGTYTKDDILSEIKTIIIAGSDTSATSSSFTILLLAMNPDIQDKVYDEINRLLPDELTLTAINELKFLDMVIKESLRLFPIAPYIGRKVSGDFKMGNFNIPAGATVGVSVYNLHRNFEVWGADANKFNPDNFLGENVSNRHPFSYIPFASGARNCIGDKYAMLSMKILIINLLRGYKFSTDLKLEEMEVEMHITLKNTKKCLVSVKPRR